MAEQQKSREVDLIQLFNSMKSGIINLITSVWDLIMWCLFFAVKKYIYLIAFALLGLALGFVNTSKFEQVYKSDMILRSNAVDSKKYALVLKELNEYFGDDSEVALKHASKLTGLSTDVLATIKGIDVFPAIDINNDETIDLFDDVEAYDISDTTNIVDLKFLKVRAYVSDPAVFPRVKEGIMHFSSNHPYLVNANKARLNYASEVVGRLAKESKMMEYFQESQYGPAADKMLSVGGNGVTLRSIITPIEYSRHVDIIRRKYEQVEELQLYNDMVSCINDFPVVSKTHGSKVFTIVKFAILSLILGYVLLLIIYYLSKVSGKYLAKI